MRESIVTVIFRCLVLFGDLAGGKYRHDAGLTLDHAGFVGDDPMLRDEIMSRIEKKFVFAPPEGGSIIAGRQPFSIERPGRLPHFVPLPNRQLYHEPIVILGQRPESLAQISVGYQGMREGGGFVAYAAADLNAFEHELWMSNVDFMETTLYGRRALRIDLDRIGTFRAYVIDQNLSDTMKQLAGD